MWFRGSTFGLVLHVTLVAPLAQGLAPVPVQQVPLHFPEDRRAPSFPPHAGERPTGFVAFGDSYSAGIGTGFEGYEDDCRHGLNAYPVLILNDLADPQPLGSNSSFQFLSCAGSTTDDLLSGGGSSQIDDFNITATADFALLSIGGNDLGFFQVMNACIFRFYSFYSGTCEEALQQADAAIASQQFELRLLLAIMEILDKVHWERRHWFTVTVTGYARFFNADTALCDDCSFGVWRRGPKLTREARQRMNEMVIAVNNKIRRSVNFVNSRFISQRVHFADIDACFEGHRFCELNVTEPDYNRNETWFFLVGGADNAPSSTHSLPPNVPPLTDGRLLPSFNQLPTNTNLPRLQQSSPLVDPEKCLGPAQASGDWGKLALCYMAMARQKDPSLQYSQRGGDEVEADNSMGYVPTYYGKTFHPKTLGHRAIRDQLYALWHSINDRQGRKANADGRFT